MKTISVKKLTLINKQIKSLSSKLMTTKKSIDQTINLFKTLEIDPKNSISKSLFAAEWEYFRLKYAIGDLREQVRKLETEILTTGEN
ncbi:MAG: hypothetical protein WC389_14515 [Lutibacter sp.]|jgi:hypothetical protein